MSKRWFIYLISLMAVVALGGYFLPQALEWYNALGVNRMEMYSDLLGGIITGALIGVIFGFIISNLAGSIIAGIVCSVLAIHASSPAALVFFTSYMVFLFPTYLIKTHYKPWDTRHVERKTIPGNWAAYFLGLMFAIMIGSYFSHQVIEWHNGLSPENQTFVIVLAITGIIIGILFGIFMGTSQKGKEAITVAIGVIIGAIIFTFIIGRIESVDIGLSFGISLPIIYFIAFFPIYFIKNPQKPKVFERIAS